MSNPEIFTFDEKRNAFKPYGLTCELWMPGCMKKPDRHNEIEVNLFANSSLTYLFQGHKVTIPENCLSIFWGLVPHQIVAYAGYDPYYVLTIPLNLFLDWRLPAFFADKILRGEVVIEEPGAYSPYDKFLFDNWVKDLSEINNPDATLYEMQARLLRMASRILPQEKQNPLQISTDDTSTVEQIALYIARNYMNPFKLADIGEEIGLHPDYANVIFKKAFGTTINDYVIQERIMQAQRMLLTTDKKIADIAFECGFNSINRFNAAFRKINGCTPREFKKR
jgi:AraC-like DNA-binding protein